MKECRKFAATGHAAAPFIVQKNRIERREEKRSAATKDVLMKQTCGPGQARAGQNSGPQVVVALFP